MKRLLLTLESGPLDLPRLEPFIRLAAELGIELDTLLIENQDLLTVAGLPFCHEVIRDSARARPLSPDSVQRTTQNLSRELQRHLGQLARSQALHWQLRVHRGHWCDCLGEDWARTELLVVTGAASTLGAVSSRSLMKKAVALLCGGKDSAGLRALRLAARLAATQHKGLLVLALPSCPYRHAPDLSGLPPDSGPVRFEQLASADPDLLRSWLPGLADTLVLPQTCLWPDGRPAAHPLLELPGIQAVVVR